jgi:hypothetical protein
MTTAPASEASKQPFPWNLPFADFVHYAVEQERAHQEEWRSPLWEFTRLIKSWSAEDTTALKAFAAVERALAASGGWQGVFAVTDEEAWTEFSSTWKKVRWRKAHPPIHQALLKAKAYPVTAPNAERRPRPPPGYDGFISVVGWLQHTMGNERIYLPVPEIGAALKTDKRMISLWRQQAVEEGVLEIVAEHKFHPSGKGKATEFRVTEGFASWFRENYAKKVSRAK